MTVGPASAAVGDSGEHTGRARFIRVPFDPNCGRPADLKPPAAAPLTGPQRTRGRATFVEAPTEGCRETFLESFVESPALDVPWTLVVLPCRRGGWAAWWRWCGRSLGRELQDPGALVRQRECQPL